MTRPERSRHGLTLVEVLAALTIGALVLATAALLLDRSVEARARLSVRGDDLRRHATGERYIRGLVDRLEVGTPESGAFHGDSGRVRFTSWCDVSGGWQERCDVALVIEHTHGAASRISVHTSSDDSVTVPVIGGALTFLYLRSAHSGGDWLRSWGSSVVAPLAIAVVTATDTLILRIGPRG